jgi:DNA-binding LytR/AlgR family response regulator
MPIRCLLLDDELPGLAYLKMLCEQLPGLHVVKAFDRPEKFLSEAESLNFDLCILDIEMAETDGLEVARKLNGKPVIFTTAYKQYAADAFEIDAVDYLLKPVKRERLAIAVEKAVRKIAEMNRNKVRTVSINTNKGRMLLPFDKIACISTSDIDSRDKTALMTDGSSILLKNVSFGTLLSLLPSDGFCRINRREIIAMQRVAFFSHNKITTTIVTAQGPLILHLNEAYRSDFMLKAKQ